MRQVRRCARLQVRRPATRAAGGSRRVGRQTGRRMCANNPRARSLARRRRGIRQCATMRLRIRLCGATLGRSRAMHPPARRMSPPHQTRTMAPSFPMPPRSSGRWQDEGKRRPHPTTRNLYIFLRHATDGSRDRNERSTPPCARAKQRRASQGSNALLAMGRATESRHARAARPPPPMPDCSARPPEMPPP